MLTEDQAIEAMKILNEECRANIDERDDEGFVRYVTTDNKSHEWRFMGALGSGGKFRMNSGRDHPYVDCYRESETTERLAMIETANARLSLIRLKDRGRR